MATKTFLNAEELAEAETRLRPPSRLPEGDETHESDFHCFEFSRWLAEVLEKKLSAEREWQAAQPIAIGSWARDELCPKSDLDLILVGGEEAAGRLTEKLQLKGFKVRARVPENVDDWTQGVDAFPLPRHQAERSVLEALHDLLHRRRVRAAEYSAHERRHDHL